MMMKPGVYIRAAAIGCVLLLVAGGVTGCASSSLQAKSGRASQDPRSAGVVPGHFASQPSWSVSRGSVVSPLGDAPGERDLEVMTGWTAKPLPAGERRSSSVAQAFPHH